MLANLKSFSAFELDKQTRTNISYEWLISVGKRVFADHLQNTSLLNKSYWALVNSTRIDTLFHWPSKYWAQMFDHQTILSFLKAASNTCFSQFCQKFALIVWQIGRIDFLFFAIHHNLMLRSYKHLLGLAKRNRRNKD